MADNSIAIPKGENTVSSFDGVPISYVMEGSGEPALVFVHGWACDKTHWNAQLTHFATTNTVVAIDLAGHGKSGSQRTDWTIQNFGKDVQAVVEELDLRQAVLLGHSMGGPVVLEAEHLVRNRVAAIIGVDTFTNEGAYPKLDRELIEQILAPVRTDFIEFVKGMVRGLFSARTDPDFVEDVAATMSRLSPEIGIPALEALLEWDLAQALEQTRSPIRCINSRSFYDEEVGRRYAQYFDVVVVHGVGHFPMMEDPLGFNQCLEEVMKELVDAEIPG